LQLCLIHVIHLENLFKGLKSDGRFKSVYQIRKRVDFVVLDENLARLIALENVVPQILENLFREVFFLDFIYTVNLFTGDKPTAQTLVIKPSKQPSVARESSRLSIHGITQQTPVSSILRFILGGIFVQNISNHL
jgi:hypothetical protein